MVSTSMVGQQKRLISASVKPQILLINKHKSLAQIKARQMKGNRGAQSCKRNGQTIMQVKVLTRVEFV